MLLRNQVERKWISRTIKFSCNSLWFWLRSPSGSSTTSGELDAVMAKIVYKFSLQTKKLAILGGFYRGEDVKECSYKFGSITNKRVLLSQVVQLLMSPVSGFARVLDGISKNKNQLSLAVSFIS